MIYVNTIVTGFYLVMARYKQNINKINVNEKRTNGCNLKRLESETK